MPSLRRGYLGSDDDEGVITAEKIVITNGKNWPGAAYSRGKTLVLRVTLAAEWCK
jgi:hypothetical protein